jgi:hypothetical protein
MGSSMCVHDDTAPRRQELACGQRTPDLMTTEQLNGIGT